MTCNSKYVLANHEQKFSIEDFDLIFKTKDKIFFDAYIMVRAERSFLISVIAFRQVIVDWIT